MSGIAAIIRFDGGQVEPGSIEMITEALSYRGPDGIQHRALGSVALGHCMLHTTLESLEEHQPLFNEDESVALVMDGWLGNWEELRSELLSKGAHLRTRSDAELVLRAYERWGEDCPSHLEGEFAFVVWNGRRCEALCVRDHAGLRPLHYSWDGKRLIVASDIAGVLAVPGVEQRPNRGMIAEYMASEFISEDETIWCDVMRLPLASHAVFAREGTRITRYWSPQPKASIRYQRDEDYFEQYRELFAECVRRASRTHLPLACEVSGGIDSSAVFAMAHRLHKEGRLQAPSVRGYTLRFDASNRDADEIEYARAVGEYVGEEIMEVSPFFPDLPWFEERGREDRDIPPYPSGVMGLALGERAVRDGARVILSGSGGDEWLDGSPLYYAEAMAAKNWSALYRYFREDVSQVGLSLSAWWIFRFGFAQFLPPRALKLRHKVLTALGQRKPDDRYWLSTELRELLQLRRARIQQDLCWRDSFRTRLGISRWHDDRFNCISCNQGARNCARTGFERRSPMFSRRFIEFAFAIPERLRSRGGMNKFIHRKALAGLLPDVVANRATKAEFSLSFSRLLDEMRELFVEDLPRNGGGCLDAKGMDRLFGSYRTAGNSIWELWGIFGCENAIRSVRKTGA